MDCDRMFRWSSRSLLPRKPNQRINEVDSVPDRPRPTLRSTVRVRALDATPEAWHLATTHGIYRSTDEGGTWENLTG